MTQQKINHTPATHVPRAFQRATQHPKRWGINRPRPRRVRCGPDQSEHHGLKQASHALKFRLVTSLSIELQNGLSKSMVRALRAGPVPDETGGTGPGTASTRKRVTDPYYPGLIAHWKGFRTRYRGPWSGHYSRDPVTGGGARPGRGHVSRRVKVTRTSSRRVPALLGVIEHCRFGRGLVRSTGSFPAPGGGTCRRARSRYGPGDPKQGRVGRRARF